MKAIFAAVLAIGGGMALGGEPKIGASRSIARVEATDATSTDSSAKPSKSDERLPSPSELIKKLRNLEKDKDAKSKIAYFDLSTRPLTEKPADFSLFGDDGSMTLRSVVDRLHQARDDKDIKGVLITLGDGGVDFSQAQELRDALKGLTDAGKATFAYSDSYDTDSYVVASGAKHICLLEGGEVMIPGVGLETTFYKGLFDKVGVKADYVQIGEYKGADEEYTRTEASPELKGELTRLTEGLYGQIVEQIATARHLSTDDVKQVIDQTILSAADAKERGLVDVLTDQDDLRKLISNDVGNEVELVGDYGRSARAQADPSNPMSLFTLMMKKPQPETDKPQVALIYAEGVIEDGEPGGLFGGDGIGSETIRHAMRIAVRDDNIKAIVIRIDSPGGSALASEVMWQAVRHAAEKKPVVISIGSMAASGGYYLASAGDKIFADPSAIVGSIGVVGGKFVLKGVYDWAGVHTETFSKGKNAGLFSSSAPWDDRQRAMVTHWMEGTYKQFTQRVMKTRTGKIKDIDKVARGRIFLAKDAKELGMVDEIGGIDAALQFAAKDGGLAPGAYDIRVVPAPKSLGDMIMGGAAEAAFPFKPTVQIDPDSLLGVFSPAMQKSMGRELHMMHILQAHPVVLMAPYELTIK